MKYRGIIRANRTIYKALVSRKKELELTLVDICMDAEIRGMHILLPSLSKYFTESDENNLTEEAIVWLATRYGIPIELSVGVQAGFTFEIPEYNEKKALADLRKRFPKKRKK